MGKQVLNTEIKLDLFISALIHDLGKVSVEYYMSKYPSYKVPDTHGHILIDKFPHMKKHLEKKTLWAPHLSYLDIMVHHHDSYIKDIALRRFKEADRADRSIYLKLPPTHTRMDILRSGVSTIDYLGNKTICTASDIETFERQIAEAIPELIHGDNKEKIKLIRDIFRPIMSQCPNDNRPGAAVSLWDHSVSVYIYLMDTTIRNPLMDLSHPDAILMHPYGPIDLLLELIPVYNKILTHSLSLMEKNLDAIIAGIKQHLNHLNHTGELHRLLFIERNKTILKLVENNGGISPIPLPTIWREIFGIAKPPSMEKLALRIVKEYLTLRFLYGYSHIGALMHMFYRRKVGISELMGMQGKSGGPFIHLLSTPHDKLQICQQPPVIPEDWIYMGKSHGIPIKENLFATQTPSHVLINTSKVFLKWIRPEGDNFTINCHNNATNIFGRNQTP